MDRKSFPNCSDYKLTASSSTGLWMPLPPEKTQRGHTRTPRHDLPRDIRTLCRSDDRYHILFFVFFCLAHDIYTSARSVRELSLSETAGVLYRRATESYLRISSADMVNISLNMHGTCAVQKMIDFLSTGRQASLIPSALSLQNLRWRV